MSDPMNTRSPDLPPPEPQRKSSSPLIWILVLIALIALGWYFYNRHGASEPISDLTPPAATSDAMTPTESSSVEREATARKAAADAAAKKRKAVAKAETRSRAASLINQPKPTYPPEAYRSREEGTVVVMAQVDADGNASDVKVVKRSGSRVLDRAATNEVRKWKFKPAMKDGKAVASAVQVPVDYRLEDQ
jgi:periplasmic protein TonB